jgi:hypothetical protein
MVVPAQLSQAVSLFQPCKCTAQQQQRQLVEIVRSRLTGCQLLLAVHDAHALHGRLHAHQMGMLRAEKVLQ